MERDLSMEFRPNIGLSKDDCDDDEVLMTTIYDPGLSTIYKIGQHDCFVNFGS